MSFLKSAIRQFRHYKELAEKAMAQPDDAALLHEADGDNNSIVVIVKHMRGNMLSRWTNFLTEDGEKPWRTRDAEFNHETLTRANLLNLWEEGWACVFGTLESLTDADLTRTIHIRGEAMTAMDGILRQLAHYCYHVGQIILLCKQQADSWQSLTIPKNGSAAFNAGLFTQEKATCNS
jgi:hypothetical protein